MTVLHILLTVRVRFASRVDSATYQRLSLMALVNPQPTYQSTLLFMRQRIAEDRWNVSSLLGSSECYSCKQPLQGRAQTGSEPPPKVEQPSGHSTMALSLVLGR